MYHCKISWCHVNHPIPCPICLHKTITKSLNILDWSFWWIWLNYCDPPDSRSNYISIPLINTHYKNINLLKTEGSRSTPNIGSRCSGALTSQLEPMVSHNFSCPFGVSPPGAVVQIPQASKRRRKACVVDQHSWAVYRAQMVSSSTAGTKAGRMSVLKKPPPVHPTTSLSRWFLQSRLKNSLP